MRTTTIPFERRNERVERLYTIHQLRPVWNVCPFRCRACAALLRWAAAAHCRWARASLDALDSLAFRGVGRASQTTPARPAARCARRAARRTRKRALTRGAAAQLVPSAMSDKSDKTSDKARKKQWSLRNRDKEKERDLERSGEESSGVRSATTSATAFARVRRAPAPSRALVRSCARARRRVRPSACAADGFFLAGDSTTAVAVRSGVGPQAARRAHQRRGRRRRRRQGDPATANHATGACASFRF